MYGETVSVKMWLVWVDVVLHAELLSVKKWLMSVNVVLHAELYGSWNSSGPIYVIERVYSSLAQESICTSLRYSREETKQEVTYSCRPVLVCRAVSFLLLPASPENSGVQNLQGWRQESKQCSLASSFPRTVLSQQKYAFCLDSSQSWGNRWRCEMKRLWRSSLGKAAPRNKSAAPENCTIRRGLDKRQTAPMAVLDLSYPCEANPPCTQELPYHSSPSTLQRGKFSLSAILHSKQRPEQKYFV